MIAPTALSLQDSRENKKASHAKRTVATIRSNTMAQTQSETLTRRDALATGATLLGATAFATTGLSADEPKSRRKVRIGVVGGNFGAAFQWHQHPNCLVTGVTDLRAD